MTLLSLLTAGTASIALMNKWVQLSAVQKNLMDEPDPLCYKWRLGNIHYTKSGSGRPLLLIHDLNASSSGYEYHLLTAIRFIHLISLAADAQKSRTSLIQATSLYS